MYKHFKAPLLRGFFLSLILLIQTSVFAVELNQHQDGVLWYSVSSDSYSEAMTIMDIFEDNPESISKGEIIYSYSQWQIGYQLNEYVGFGLIRGLDLYAEHSPDAARIYYADNVDNQELEERRYNYQLEGDMQRTQGLFITFSRKVKGLSIYTMLEAGQAFGLTSIDIDGDLNYQDGQLVGSADIDYFYEKDALYKREVDSAQGKYWSVSLKLKHSSLLGKHELTIKDLFNQTYWSSAPYTHVLLNTDRVATTDENGNISFRPLGSGIETYKSKTQIFPSRIDLRNYLEINDKAEMILGVKSISDNVWPYLGFAASKFNLNLTYHINEQSLALYHKVNSNVLYQLEVDQADIEEMQRIQFGLEISY